MNTKLYTAQGAEAGSVELPASVFDVAWNADLVHGVVVAMQANGRAGTADTKGRGDVRGGGKKPWKQKGTGRARHGSSRSPIWAGGGAAHGPKSEKDYTSKINKKMRAKALASVLTKKFADTEIIFLSELAMTEPKAALGKTILKAIATGTNHLSSSEIGAPAKAYRAIGFLRKEFPAVSTRNLERENQIQCRCAQLGEAPRQNWQSE